MQNFKPEFFDGETKSKLTLDRINKAIRDQEILEAIVASCSDDFVLTMKFGNNIKGIIEFDEVEYRFDGANTKNIAALSKVGKHVAFIPQRVEQTDEGTVVICSRREAQKVCYDEYISKLVPGDIIDARVLRTEDYGSFCDIGCGIVALLPTNLISVTHITSAKRLMKNVKNIKAVVKSIQEDGRIQLSHRELLGTWDEEVRELKAGSTIFGTVLSIEEYGIFVRVTQNVSGLATINEEIDVKSGDVVSVYINSINPATMKIKLSIVEKIDDTNEETEFNYYQEEGHISKWRYTSSEYASDKKIIETDFDAISEE